MTGGGPADDDARRLAELGLLTAGLIHELRQPLFAMKALVQMGAAAPERLAGSVPQILTQIAHMESLLRGYGDFSRRPGAAAELFDVDASVRSATIILEHRARQVGARLSVVSEPGALVRGSMLGIQQAIVNLGENALVAVGRDGAVEVRVEVDARGVGIVIRDDGPGLPEEIRAHLFEPFRTTRPTGTGLGLGMARDLVVACGGDLRLRDGPGTCWDIRLLRAG